MVFKKCFIPKCLNTTENSDKLFIVVPKNPAVRQLWFKVIYDDYKNNTTVFYCCEDHFDLENDAKNWERYKSTGKKILLRDGVVPYRYISSPNTEWSGYSQLPLQFRKRKLETPSASKKQKDSDQNFPMERGGRSSMNALSSSACNCNCCLPKIEDSLNVINQSINDPDVKYDFTQTVHCKQDTKQEIEQEQDEQQFSINDDSGFIKTEIDIDEMVHYQCPECDYTTDIFTSYLEHIGTYHNVEKFKLDDEDVKPYNCETCQRAFSQQDDFECHMRTHSEEMGRPFQCSICSRSFQESCYLTNHMMKHTKKRRYQCNVCDKSFAYLGKLTNHKKTHETFLPYECGICQKSFMLLDGLECHMRQHMRKV